MIVRFIKDWTLLLAMLTGALLYEVVGQIAFLTPYLIFTMLLLTFCRLSPREVKFNRLHGWMLLIQLGGSLAVYLLLRQADPVLASGAMVCILVSTATSAAVVTGMLGGDVAFLTTYTLLSSLAVAIAAPIVFSLIGPHSDMPFSESFLRICRQVGPLLILPLLAAWTIRALLPGVHRRLTGLHRLSFYLWAIALCIVTGKTVRFLAGQENPGYRLETAMAATALLICAGQFLTGRYLGRRYNDDAVSAGQGLGQKNTILAIWMAQVYLDPIASVAPAAYVLWQNLINSYQLWRHAHKR